MNFLTYIRQLLALIAAKIYILIASVTKLRASTLPGALALKICPQIIYLLSKQVPRVILVTGTNGKTTTNNMIRCIFESAGYLVVCNREGANLASGVATALIKSSSLSGKIKANIACLEVDEAAFPSLVQVLNPQNVVITNFFRDQLDRYGEIDTTITHIRKSLKNLKHSPALVLNADDPLVANFKNLKMDSFFFGLDVNKMENYNIKGQTREGRFCPDCGTELVYTSYIYGQLGNYSCPSCSFKRPRPDITASAQPGNSVLFLDIQYGDTELNIVLPARGLYNAYNALAAVAIGHAFNIENSLLKSGIENYKPVFGRMEIFAYLDKTIYLNLVKNPTGFNEGLKTMLADKNRKDIFFALNDNHADGRDISWIWDVDFEMLEYSQDLIDTISFSGTRAEEIALRLKYAGLSLKNSIVQSDLSKAVNSSINGKQTTVYLFTTYTALWPVRKILIKSGAKEQLYVKDTPHVSRSS